MLRRVHQFSLVSNVHFLVLSGVVSKTLTPFRVIRMANMCISTNSGHGRLKFSITVCLLVRYNVCKFIFSLAE